MSKSIKVLFAAKEIGLIDNDIEQKVPINDPVTNVSSMSCSLIQIKPLEK